MQLGFGMYIYPSLTYGDLEAAIEQLQVAFGLQVEERNLDAGNLRAFAMRYGEGRVLLQPDLPEELHGTHVGQAWLYVAVQDPDAHWRRAGAAGAEVLNEPHNVSNGAQGGYSPATARETCGVSATIAPETDQSRMTR